MNRDTFSKNVELVKKLKPEWFLCTDGQIATPKNISAIEKSINAKLPDEFTFFSLNYEAGYFGFINIFSLSPDSEWYLPSKTNEHPNVALPSNFIAFSDDETGGYYGFIKNDTNHSNKVYHLDSSTNETTPTNLNFFEFVISNAFKPEHFEIPLP
ncbi:SMI1/KNR4 family protein [Pseudomonas sp. 18175]|uniref:SMI1/KNR4 family protein n=1 Tax=Pseudomonas sp. 18175 TaxID=3390056 RepID=UPI003D25E748